MYSQILVALDGSELPERILPHVAALGQKFGSVVTLVQVIPPPSLVLVPPVGAPVPPPVTELGIVEETMKRETGEYLGRIAASLRAQGLTVEWECPEGLSQSTIVLRAGELRADLIAMTTQGAGGLKRRVFGSVAEEVLREAPCPLLLARPSDERRDGE